MGKKKNKKFLLGERMKSFAFAWNGLKIFWREEPNSRIHFLATAVVIITGFLLKISKSEWFAVLLSIGFVLVTEIINTSIENLADFVSPGKDDRIKKIKDLSAAAVFIAAVTALLIGLIIFLPKIVHLLFY